MANRYLLPLFKKLYDTDFRYSDFSKRMEMQKAVYLLQDMGVPVGDYGFRWYLHGPYSQNLLDDMYYEDGRTYMTLAFYYEYAYSIERLKSIIHSTENKDYSICEWVECLASLHYLKKNIMQFGATQEEVVLELEKKKKHLNKHETNMIAYQLVEGLFS